MARPRVSRAPKASWSRPVMPERADQGRARRPVPHRPDRGQRPAGAAAKASNASGRAAAMAAAITNGPSTHSHVQHAGPRVPQDHGEGALARHGVRGDVAQVVDHQQRAGQQPHRHGAASASHGSESISTNAVPATAASPKNANTAISPRPWYPYGCRPAGVGPGRGDGRRAQQDQPPGGHRGQDQPGHAGHREAAEGSVPDLPWRRRARRRPAGPGRPAPRRCRGSRRCSRWRS